MMKSLLLSISCLLTSISFQGQIEGTSASNVEFVIVIPSYKNEGWARENLHSACIQKSSRPYQVICINDCSPDKTGEIMDTYVRENNLQSKVTVIHNEKRLGAMTNWYNTIHSYIPDHKIVVNLDGDDQLAHDNVLLTLEKYYSDPDIWLTYGQGRTFPSPVVETSERIPDSVFWKNKVRWHPFCAPHLRTFKASLFKKIKKEDLFVEGCDLVPDFAFMIPMLEMCSPTKKSPKNHSMFIPEMLYLHRKDSPIHVFKVAGKAQIEAAELIKTKEPYKPIDRL